ncbi:MULTISPECIES: hypothetical protein [unclassified Streptomyces]|uniref:hypothetical protein n=1 Tax=unclassified Streptomyces TaxID=2593676 RepID=UPI002E28B795|nr:hypothetical protein [Streptomyces sp. NBC_00223]
MNRSAHWRRGLATAAVALLLATGAAACGGSKGESAGDSGSADAATGVKYAACMREQGVEVADPKPGDVPKIPEGVAQDLLVKAAKVCGQAPGSDAGRVDDGGGLYQDPKVQALSLELQKCMRDNGWSPPKPQEENGSVSLDAGDPAYQQAKKACKTITDELDRYFQQGNGQ